MTSRVAYYFEALAVILMHSIIFPVKGQSTAPACEYGDLSNGINTQQTVDAIHRLDVQIQSIFELFSESFQHLKNQQDVVLRNLQAAGQNSQGQNFCISQVQGIYEYFNSSFLQMQHQQDTIMTFLQAVDRHSQEHVQNIHDILNWTIQQMENQQDTVFKSLQAVDRRSREQSIYIKQVHSIHELFNASFQEHDMQNLNVSLQQIKNQQDTVVSSLEAFDRRSQKQEQDMKNRNVSLQQMKNQQDTVVTSLHAVDRRLQKQEQDMHNLNVSLQQMKIQQDTVALSLQAFDRRSQKQEQDMQNLNVSLQQMKNQQDTVVTSLQAVDRRSQKQEEDMQNLKVTLQEMKIQLNKTWSILEVSDRRLREKDIFIRNQTQNLWKLAIAYGSDLGEVPILQPTVNDWIVLMSRFDGSLNFSRSWGEYKTGFGDTGRGEFWLGNEKIHRLTNRFLYRLHMEVQLKSNGQWYYADYDTFSIDSEGSKYTLRLSGFSGGTAGDSLINTSLPAIGYLGGMSFSTFDADNDRSSGNCAHYRKGGWWFNDCTYACFTCSYNFWW